MTRRNSLIRTSWITLALLLAAAPGAAQNRLAITPVTVVDVTDGSLRTHQTVLVEGKRIAMVGSADEVTLPDDAEVIDGASGYLIPGLWDMHVHTANSTEWVEAFFPLFLANGVTGVRDMWHYRKVAEAAEAAVADGELAGPLRVVVAGNLIDGPARIWPNSLVAFTPEQGEHLVDSLHDAGAPFIKVYSSLTPETYHAIAARARELEIPVAGHIPAGVRAADASDAGHRSVEHFYGVLEGCSAEEDSILVAFGKAMRAAGQPGAAQTVRGAFETRHRRTIATQDDERCRALADRFAGNETWQVPTLVANRGDVFAREMAAAGDERLRYVPSWVIENDWAPWIPAPDAGPSPYAPILHTPATWERSLEVIEMMAERDVPFLAGSDTPNPWALPGFGLHDELELLVDAGMTSLQALQAATLNPARFFGRTDELGTVEAGKLADLVLLEADPLKDITNTRLIRAVVADGRVYSRDRLDEILAGREKAARD